MTRHLEFRVYGLPAPQGSKRHVGNGVMVESSKKVKPWRQDVVQAALTATAMHEDYDPFVGPVGVRIIFYFPRPKYHFGTGRNAGILKAGAAVFQTANPDLDKCVRSTFDALTTAGVWRDDNLAARVTAEKRFDTLPGAFIQLTPLQVTA